MDRWKHNTMTALFWSWNKVYSCTKYQFRELLSLWCNLWGFGMTGFDLFWHKGIFFYHINFNIIDVDIYRKGFFSLFRNRMKCVLFKFKDNLFIWSQSTTLTIISFIVLIRSSVFFLDRNIFESSAKSKENIFLETLLKSWINNRNKSGPNIEPCGIPHIILYQSLHYYIQHIVLFQKDSFKTIWGLTLSHQRILVFYTV